MSTSPRPRQRFRPVARVAIFALTVVASITSSTAVVGLDPVEEAVLQETTVGTTATLVPVATTTAATQPEPAPSPIPNDPCGEFLADYCVEVPLPALTPPDDVASCTTDGTHSPQGSITVVPGTSAEITSGKIVRIRVEVEDGLAIDGDCFAAEAMAILTDERGWSDIDEIAFARVDGDSYDLRLILTSPGTTDALCYPARTAGRYSCRKENRVVINLMRWESGTDDYVGNLTTYRSYLINHEVGHFLGRGHLSCPAAGEPAPVMMQQTKGLNECLPNGWPTKDEH